MAELLFSIAEMRDEVLSMNDVAEPFLDPAARDVLRQFAQQLDGLRLASDNSSVAWQISEALPLRTRVSEGFYDRRGGSLSVSGHLTCRWEIAAHRDPHKKKHDVRLFRLIGNATTRVRLFEHDETGPSRELAMWRIEIGDDASPGCHFHVQVLGEGPDPPFPHALPVPRLPGLLISPMDTLEFTIGELFQNAWVEQTGRETKALLRWRALQREKFSRLLQWQLATLSATGGSAWTALKVAKPQAGLFAST